MPEELDLTNCDREQIQHTGAIQPHGALLVLREPDLTILQVSSNSAVHLGLAPADLLGQGLEAALGEEVTERLTPRLEAEALDGALVHLLTARPARSGRDLHLFGNRIDGVLLLEVEPVDALARAEAPGLYQRVHTTIRRLQSSRTLQELFDLSVVAIRDLTGYDRVLAYRFEEDGSGEVFAESAQPGLETYLGLHYPAADIPEPARRLFSLKWLRHLPDVDYVPARLIPQENPLTGGPLDLSHSFLRSMSAMHIGYLKNMEVKGTLVTTLLKDGRLWGLVSCMNHAGPRYVPCETRLAVEFLAHMVSLLMGAKAAEEQHRYRSQLSRARAAQLDAVLKAGTLHQGLLDGQVLTALEADGVALVTESQLTRLGLTPPPEAVRALADWVVTRETPIVATHRLSADFPPAAAYAETASGLLAIRLSRSGPACVMWFRRELPQTVNWAGDPRKPVVVSRGDGETRLMPRTSFALWQELVSAQARPWIDCELEHAADLRQGIMELLVGHTEQLQRANTELAASNQELDTFAYAASHDLKEPLRGIHNFVQFLQDEDGEQLSEHGKRRLETIIRLTRRMDDLIESLLQYSRVGRIELDLRPVDLDDVLAQTLETLQTQLQTGAIQVRRVGRLPVTRCDRVRAGEIFTNLISNAIKYNDKADRWIEIGCDLDLEPPVFFVRDNGIGIAPRHFARIFQIFRRLHGRDAYGGGTGAGLTITKRAIERHGGWIWVESVPGEGTTFRFTLGPENGKPAKGGENCSSAE